MNSNHVRQFQTDGMIHVILQPTDPATSSGQAKFLSWMGCCVLKSSCSEKSGATMVCFYCINLVFRYHSKSWNRSGNLKNSFGWSSSCSKSFRTTQFGFRTMSWKSKSCPEGLPWGRRCHRSPSNIVLTNRNHFVWSSWCQSYIHRDFSANFSIFRTF